MLYRIVIGGAIMLVVVPQFNLGAEVVSLAGMLTPMVISSDGFLDGDKNMEIERAAELGSA